MHHIVKATIALNPVMRGLVNNMITHMDSVFGYQKQRDLEKWWDLNMPRYGSPNVKGTQLD